MENEKLIHDLIVERLRGRLSREYSEVKVDAQGGPDMVLVNHGLTMASVEVETERSITAEKAGKWRQMIVPGTRLILMVPKPAKAKVMELLWKEGIADKVGVGSYEIVITMP